MPAGKDSSIAILIMQILLGVAQRYDGGPPGGKLLDN